MNINVDDKTFWRKLALCVAIFGGITVIVRAVFSFIAAIIFAYFFYSTFNNFNSSMEKSRKEFKESREKFDREREVYHRKFNAGLNEHFRSLHDERERFKKSNHEDKWWSKDKPNQFAKQQNQIKDNMPNEEENVNSV